LKTYCNIAVPFIATMPRQTVASCVLVSAATPDEIWSALRALDYRSPPLSATAISGDISWVGESETVATSAESDVVTSELSALASSDLEGVTQRPSSRYVAERLGLARNVTPQGGLRFTWVERERDHRDMMEDARLFRRQARRMNQLRVLPLTQQVLSRHNHRRSSNSNDGNSGVGRLLTQYYIEWASATTIFCSDLGRVPYRSMLTTDMRERQLEMQYGLSLLHTVLGASVTLLPAQMEALLVEQHNHSESASSRFLCSSGAGGVAAAKVLDGRYWDVCSGSATALAVFKHALSGLAAAVAAASNNMPPSSQQQQQQPQQRGNQSTFSRAIHASICAAVRSVLVGASTGGSGGATAGSATAELAGEAELAVLCVGVAALMAFMQVNFTGPRMPELESKSSAAASPLLAFVEAVNTAFAAASSEEAAVAGGGGGGGVGGGTQNQELVLSPYDAPPSAALGAKQVRQRQAARIIKQSAWLDYLSVDGETVYARATHPELLCLAASLLRCLHEEHEAVAAAGTAGDAPPGWSSSWWLMRCCATWQRLIEDSHAQSLWTLQTTCFERLRQRGVVWDPPQRGGASNTGNNSSNSGSGGGDGGGSSSLWEALDMPRSLAVTRASLCALAYQERAVALAQIENFRDSRECVRRAGAALGIEIVVTGAQGRGTKFQTFDTPQLVAMVKQFSDPDDDAEEEENNSKEQGSSGSSSSGGGGGGGGGDDCSSGSSSKTKAGSNDDAAWERHRAMFLQGAKLRDRREAAGVRTVSVESVDPYSHLMDQPILSERRAEELVNRTVPAIGQAMMLAECRYIQGSAAVDATVQSQMKTFLSQAVRQPQVWAVQTLALFEKSLLEMAVSRMPERALLQLQALVDQHTRCGWRLCGWCGCLCCVVLVWMA
jgi:hypothetical protein